MAGELVSFGLQKLWNLLSQECERFQGVEDQVSELKRALNLLSSFLKDAYAKKHTRAVVKNCVEDIKEIVYDAEDIIETYLLKEELKKTSGIKNRIRRLASIIPERRVFASDMLGISKRISKVICDMEKFGVQQIIADGMDSQPVQERIRVMRQEFATEYKNDLVGLEENVKRLVGYLVEKDDVQVVSITGMGGLGKTTLARQAFNHDMVKSKFDSLVWVCVSQVFTWISVWQTILRTLGPNKEENKIVEMTETTLHDKLFRLLATSKSIIVLDDIWKEEDWDLIKPIFPPGKGWNVLLTSRNERVGMRRNTTYINFKPKCLTTKDSCTLFQRIALPRKDISELKVYEEMEKMGKKMIEHCGGLPLAVRVFGGLLAEKYTLHDWKQISLESYLMGRNDFNDDNNSSFYHILSLSFEELPSNLKHCFLYLADFPEDYQISVEKLSYYWAAEGFAKPRYTNGETIRDVGDSYIEELVRRNMVISERDTKTLRFETCHMHDMMREICLFKAKEENILQLNRIGSPTANSQPRRFVWQNPSTLDVEREMNNQKLRSLFVILDLGGKYWQLYGSRFTRLELLRMLDLDKARFEGGKLPSGIGKLIHLRYLSLFDAKVSHLPSSLRNLKLIIYLNIDVDYMFVPNVLNGMKELRYLALPKHMYVKTKLELSNLVNLETLINFSTRESNLEDLHGMARLRTLKITSTEASIETLSASMAGLRHLENLDIVSCNWSERVNEGIVFDFNDLKQLRLSIYMPSLPVAKHLSSHLTYISLQNCRLKNDPMPILEKLLQLKEVEIWEKSFCGRRMVCSTGGFPQLKKLVLYELEEWEEWIVEEGSMPLLHTLFIRSCPKWKEWRVEEGSMPLLHTLTVRTCRKLTRKLPDGLRLIYSLKELIVYNMDERFTFSFEDLKLDKDLRKRLSLGGKDHYKVQHIPSVRVRFERL